MVAQRRPRREAWPSHLEQDTGFPSVVSGDHVRRQNSQRHPARDPILGVIRGKLRCSYTSAGQWSRRWECKWCHHCRRQSGCFFKRSASTGLRIRPLYSSVTAWSTWKLTCTQRRVHKCLFVTDKHWETVQMFTRRRMDRLTLVGPCNPIPLRTERNKPSWHWTMWKNLKIVKRNEESQTKKDVLHESILKIHYSLMTEQFGGCLGTWENEEECEESLQRDTQGSFGAWWICSLSSFRVYPYWLQQKGLEHW